MSIWWFSRILGEIFFQDLKKPGKGGKGERSSEGEPSPCQEEGEEEGEEAAEGGAGEGEEQGGEGEGAGGEEEEGEEVEATVRLLLSTIRMCARFCSCFLSPIRTHQFCVFVFSVTIRIQHCCCTC